jgi:hypothetical protein
MRGISEVSERRFSAETALAGSGEDEWAYENRVAGGVVLKE